MTTHKQTTSNRLPASSIVLMIAGAALLGLAVLLPFAIRAHTNEFSVASTPNVNNVTYLPATGGHHVAKILQTGQSASISWQAPASVQIAGSIGIAAMGLVAFAVLLAARGKGFREIQRLSKVQLILGVLMVATIASAYGIMRTHSQARPAAIQPGVGYALTNRDRSDMCNAIVFTSSDSFTVTPQSCARTAKLSPRRFGYGIAPAYVVLESVLYVAAPLMLWFRYAFSPQHVGGQKKGTLFP